MADQLLSIQDSSLQAIANAIRSKSGGSGSLTFPAGFKSALQGIDAYAPATKIAASTKTLTPSETSYPIPAGVHTGSGKVRILTRNTNMTNNGAAMSDNVVTPSGQTQEILPTGNYFLGTVVVNAMSAASGYYTVQTGTKTFSSQAETFSVTGLSFTPAGFIIMLQGYTGSASTNKVATLSSIKCGKSGMDHPGMIYGSNNKTTGTLTLATYVTMQNGSLSISKLPSGIYYQGTYFYMIWGN